MSVSDITLIESEQKAASPEGVELNRYQLPTQPTGWREAFYLGTQLTF